MQLASTPWKLCDKLPFFVTASTLFIGKLSLPWVLPSINKIEEVLLQKHQILSLYVPIKCAVT